MNILEVINSYIQEKLNAQIIVKNGPRGRLEITGEDNEIWIRPTLKRESIIVLSHFHRDVFYTIEHIIIDLREPDSLNKIIIHIEDMLTHVCHDGCQHSDM